jgi:hypothetical protein
MTEQHFDPPDYTTTRTRERIQCGVRIDCRTTRRYYLTSRVQAVEDASQEIRTRLVFRHLGSERWNGQ